LDQETVTVKLLTSALLALVVSTGLLPAACEHKIGQDDDTATTAATVTPMNLPPPMPAISSLPVSAFMPDGGDDDTLAQAKKYEANGQYWLARLLTEPLAFSDDSRPEEVALLARICDKQDDDACVAKCNAKLPKNMQLAIKKRDGGGARTSTSFPSARPDDTTDFAKAQKLLLAGKAKDARAILEPKLLDGRATSDEIRLLREVCKAQSDRMCVALCTSKLN
jgi:hypothetical protein